MAWYTRSFRRNLVDMHIDDWNDAFLSQFDPDAYFACLRKAHIQSPMIYLQSHVGLCNWDTKSARTHRAFLGDDKIKRLIDLCHGAGMDVIAYYSLTHNNFVYDTHPEWRILDEDGRASREQPDGGRYGLVCPNWQGYRDFTVAQLKEVCAHYDFEGMFLDMTFWPKTCYCDACRKRYFEETGRELPRIADWHDENWLLFQQRRQAWIKEFAEFCTDALHAIRPDATVEHQFSTICHDWQFGIDEGVADASDYVGGDLYGGHLQESYICKIFREASRNQPFEYMTSRCDPGLQLHTTTKTLRDLRLHNFLTLAHHGAFLVIDAIDPVGTINPKVYDRIGSMFEESIPYEPFLRGTPVAEAALVMSYDSKFDPHAAAAPASRADRSHPQLAAQIGMARVLKEMRMTYTVLPCNRLSRLTGKKLAAVTNATHLRDADINELKTFVGNGGSAYISGTTDPRLAQALLGLVYEGETPEDNTYMAPTEAGRSVFGDEYDEKYPINFHGAQPLVRNPAGHTVLATVALPYTNPSDSTRFASIHSNPPGIVTEYPAVILGRYGKGRVLWLSGSLEASQQKSYRDVVTRMTRLLAEPSEISSDAPACVEFTPYRDGKETILHAVNALDETDIPMPPFIVRVSMNARVASVKEAPGMAEADWTPIEGGVEICVKQLDLFATYVITAP